MTPREIAAKLESLDRIMFADGGKEIEHPIGEYLRCDDVAKLLGVYWHPYGWPAFSEEPFGT